MDDVVLPRDVAVGLVRHLKAALLAVPHGEDSHVHILRTLVVIERALADP